MFQVGKLHHLKVLDLSNNNIVTIEGLKVKLSLFITSSELLYILNIKVNNFLPPPPAAIKNLNWEPSQEVNLLTWLSLANNNIKSIENLNQNVHLDHLDLSGNGLTNISDLSFLKNLKTLLLHKNKINSLR